MTNCTQETAARALELLRMALGSDAEFRPGQLEAICALVDHRRSLLLVQRTGWGKSMVYQIATCLLRERGAGPTILISPLLALMRDQIRGSLGLGIRAESINSANTTKENAEVEAHLLAGETDLLLVSPERLGNPRFADIWRCICSTVGMVVVDEAHCISDWGHDFRPDYRRIIGTLRDLPHGTPILGTTATANQRVVDDVREILGGDLQVMRGKLTRDSLALYVYPEAHTIAYRLVLLEYLLKQYDGSGIIYCMTTRDCRQVAEWLQSRGLNVKPYYAKVEADTGLAREDLERQLFRNEVKALVASVALGMGFDKPDVAFVIHFQHPGSIVAYYQQIGRAGRAIDRAPIFLLHGPEDLDIHEYFFETAFPKRDQVRQVQELLGTEGGLTRPHVMDRINISWTTLNKILAHLEIAGIVARQDGRYLVVDPHVRIDYARWDRVVNQRRAELATMREYLTYQGCLMSYLAQALDDVTDPPVCGHCRNCTGREVRFEPTSEQLAEAKAFLERQDVIIEPRTIWPSSWHGARSGRIEQPNAVGRALCYYHDQGWGERVRQNKYVHDEYCDALVQASARLVREWLGELDERPSWVAAVPSMRRPFLVPEFAEKLADALGLLYREAVVCHCEHPAQKTRLNSWQQAANMQNAFLVVDPTPGPVLLVDDIVDSRWTMTVIGQLLMEAGCPAVHPFALAKAGTS